MKAAVLALGALALAGCASQQSTDAFFKAAEKIASDPRCGHIDRIQGNLGGVGGNNLAVYLERTCPARATPTAPAAPSTP